MLLPRIPADADDPPLVRDTLPGETPPRLFRATDEVPAAPAANLTGLHALHASGSAQLTPEGLALLLARVGRPLTIFDLRQESHGFIGGLPVTWYAEKNWGNVGRSREASLALEQRRLAELGTRSSVAFATSSKKDVGAGTQPAVLDVRSVHSEQQVVESVDAHYERLLVADHLRPSDEEVDRFIERVRALPEGGWVHFHCRGGKGRTTTFLALYDMLRNATRVSFDDILARQHLLSSYDLLRPTPPDHPKHAYRQERAAFIHAFHRYCESGDWSAGPGWSEWLSRRGP